MLFCDPLLCGILKIMLLFPPLFSPLLNVFIVLLTSVSLKAFCKPYFTHATHIYGYLLFAKVDTEITMVMRRDTVSALLKLTGWRVRQSSVI